MLLDSLMNAAAFPVCRVNSRAKPRPGDAVVMDNPPAHKVSGVRETIRRSGSAPIPAA